MQVEAVGPETIGDFDVAAARLSSCPRIAIPLHLPIEMPEPVRITVADESCLDHPKRGQSHGQEH